MEKGITSRQARENSGRPGYCPSPASRKLRASLETKWNCHTYRAKLTRLGHWVSSRQAG